MPNRQLQPENNFFQGLARHLKLVWALWQDSRVSPLLKLMPLGSLLYLVFPFDVPGPLDDIGVIRAATYAFVEMCPPDVVAEHRAKIERTIVGQWREDDEVDIDPEIIVDAEYEDKSNGHQS